MSKNNINDIQEPKEPKSRFQRVKDAVKTTFKAAIAAKGVQHIIASYRRNNMVGVGVSVLGTTADLVNYRYGHVKIVAPVATTISLACKTGVEFSLNGRIPFPSFKDRI